MTTAAKKEKPSALTLDPQLARDLITAVQSTLSTMFYTPTRVGDYRIENYLKTESDCSSIINMCQEGSSASLILSFRKESITFVIQSLYGDKFIPSSSLIHDTVGELANVVYGLLKTTLNSRGYSFKSAIPHVVMGEKHTVSSVRAGMSLMIPFKLEAGTFHVQIALQTES